MAERGATVNTVSAYLNDISHFKEHLNKNEAYSRIETCSKESITNYIEYLSKRGLKTRTVARRLSTLRQFFLFLQSENHRTDNPTKNIDGPSQIKSIPKLFNIKSNLSKSDLLFVNCAIAEIAAPRTPRLSED